MQDIWIVFVSDLGAAGQTVRLAHFVLLDTVGEFLSAVSLRRVQ